ncbi:TPA: retention module-containing protein, partial [Vibrio cholerae]
MEFQIVTQPVTVTSLSGDVIVVNAQGKARVVNVGDTLQPGEIIMTANQSEIVLQTTQGSVQVAPNCVGCLPTFDGQPQVQAAPIQGEINLDVSQLDTTNFDEDAIAAIQQAILDGVDPTTALEAAAAGGNPAGSANGGAVSIAYNYPEVLASTLFDTQGFSQSFTSAETFLSSPFISGSSSSFSTSAQLTEGSLLLGTYPQTSTLTTSITAGSLALLPASFTPEPTFLTALLAELNQDITSSGQAVAFRYDAATNSIVGELNGSQVLTIAITAESIGRDVNVTITTTLFQPIDHLPSVGGGLVSISGDQISIELQITGTDSGGIPIQSPIIVDLLINDGSAPVMGNEPTLSLNENDLPNGSDGSDSLSASGQFDTQLGSDQVASYQVDPNSGNLLVGLTSQGEAVILGAPTFINGNRVYQATAGGRDIFQLELNADGRYQFILQGPLDHAVGSDALTISLPIVAIDYDNDSSAPINLSIQIQDDKPSISAAQALNVSENDLPLGSDTNKEPLFMDGQFTLQSADQVVSFELDSSVNPVQGLTSNGVPVTLSAPVDDGNGNLTYTATAGTESIFTLVLNTDGSYRFTLTGALDHALNSDDLTLNFQVIATDFDGDSDSIVLPVKINDDKPYFTNVQDLNVHENDLPQGSDTDKEPVTVNGQFQLVQGADTVASFALDNSVNPVQGLTSNGVAVTLSAPVDDGHGNLTYTAMAGSVTVFTLTLNTDGTYSFTLAAPVDHALNSNDLTLNFKVIATDFDGDSDSIVLPVKINDDKPYITNVQDLNVHENDLPQGSDTDKEPVTVNGQFQLVQGADTVASFALDSSVNPVQGLTSNGVAVTLSAPVDDGNGNLTYTAMAGSVTVFTLTLNTDGTYSFTLAAPVDHALNSNDLTLNFQVIATDFDGDSDSIVLPVKINDDKPYFTNVQGLYVHENDLPQGSDTDKEPVTVNGQFQLVQGADTVASFALDSSVNPVQGLTSNGVAVTLSAPVDDGHGNLTYTAMAGAVTVFTLTLNSNGTYSFTLAAPVDHALNSNDLTLNFQVIATDFDGDSDSIVLPVKINDDKPYFNNVQGLYVHENDLPQGSDTDKEPVTVNGQFQLVQGADTVASFALDSSVNPVQGLTSNGVAVTLSAPVDDGNGNLTYTAMAGAVTVFTLTLNSNGTYSFTLAAPVDHALNSNDLTLNFKVIATDFDGDSDSIVLPVKINDDKPYFTNVQGLYVHENDLPQGSDTDKEPVTVNGQFQLVQGADTVASFALDSSVNPVQGLTSNGVAVTLSAPVDDGHGNLTYTAMAGAVTVFTLTLNSNGTYSFTLAAPVDHALNSNDLTLNFQVIATDFDGDSDSIVLPVKINDDKPYFTNVQGLYVHENDLPQGSDTDKEPVTVNGQFQLVQGADTVASFALDSSVNPVQGLTSNGVAVTLSAPVDDGHGNLTYTAMAGAVTVFTLTLNTDGTYSFTLAAPVDHALNSNDLTLNFQVIATDFDGDTASIVLPVKINDDKPSFIHRQPLSVNEDDLPQGSDTDKEPVTVNGQFQLVQGADTVASFALDSSVNPVQGLTSNGVAVTLSAPVNDGHGNLTYTAMAGSHPIFTLALNNDGSYTFTLSGPIDHAASSDELLLNFNVVATDYDGDTSSITLPVTIYDDKPSITAAQALTVNEDDLATGTDQSKESTTANGQFTTTQGADGIAHYQIDTSTSSDTGLTSQGQPVVWGAPSITTTSSGQVYTYQGIANGVVIFTLELRANGSYSFTLNGAVDHAKSVNDLQLTLNIPVLAQDKDGDTSPITLPVTIVDDAPILHEKNMSISDFNGHNVTANVFSIDNNTSPETRGADIGRIASYQATGNIQFRVGDGPLVNEITLNDGAAAPVVTVVETIDGGSRILGTFAMLLDGTTAFRPVTNLDHSNNEDIRFTVLASAIDRDGDTDTKPVNISITDRLGFLVPNIKFTGYEDQGHDAALNLVPAGEQSNAQDNLVGLPVQALQLALQVNLLDVDQEERIGNVSIRNPNQVFGDFYYKNSADELVKLEVDSTGNVVLPANLLQQTINESTGIATVDNLYFVPDRHYSSSNSGMSVTANVQIYRYGVPHHSSTGTVYIEIESVADIATWSSSSEFHYDAVEDGSNVSLNIAAQTQDSSNPEAITYQIRFTENGSNANLVYSDGSPIPTQTDSSGTYYVVPANKIAQVQVDPVNNFSGQIKLSVLAITTESTNFVTGKQTAQSEVKEIIIDVAPDADRAKFNVERISIFEDNAAHKDAVDPSAEHDPLLLSEVISMTSSADHDNSESMFVRLSEFTDTGATLVWLGTGPSPITVGTYPNGESYYEIPQSALEQVEVLPTKHSNEHFTFKVEGVVKDSATLSTGLVQDIDSLGFKTVHVTMKGVADLPVFGVVGGNAQWETFNDGVVHGVQATVEENSVVDLNFSILSGEIADSPSDSSEVISVLLSNIPAGVVVFDSDGTSVDLVFAGFDGNNIPTYQANLTVAQVLTGIQIQPISSSTANIDITATVVVTENDGHVRQVQETIRILVEPKIEVAENYHNAVSGDEDSRIDVAWVPQNTPGNVQNPDDQEYFSRVEISGFPDGSRVFVNNLEVTLVNGVLVLEPTAGQSDLDFSNQVSAAGYIQVIPPHNSSTDFTLATAITVKEQDDEYVDASNSGQGIAEKAILGSIGVKVNPIAEPDGQLLVENAGSAIQTVQADANGKIDFTINDATGGQAGANVIRFDNLDSNTAGSYQSDELVEQLVVSFGNVPQEVLNQLLITGAINNGDGTWTITHEADFSIKAPNGLVYNSNNDPDNNGFNDIKITITAKVYDQGEDSSEVKITKQVSTELTLSFPTVVTGDNSVAAQLNWVGDADDLVIGKEDNTVNLGQQIQDKLMVNATGFDAVADELSIVINASDLPAGASIGGQDFNFVDGQYVFKGTLNPDGSISGLEGLVLIPPRDFAGDFKLPITFVTTDTQSGDEKTLTAQVPVAISPVADVPSSSGDQPLDNHVTPSITLNVQETLGLDANHQPTDLANDTPTQDGIAYEDGIVHLNLAIGLADSLNGNTQGQEVLTEVTLTLNNTNSGVFVDANGQSLGTSITLTQAELPAALGEIYFKPAPNYPSGNDINTVGMTVAGKVTDSTVFDETNASSQGVSSSDADKTFTSQVSFEVLPVTDSISIQSGAPISVVGDEDSWIELKEQGNPIQIQLTDTDGSEQFVSFVLTGLPTDFLVKSSSSDYVVKNSGGGEWSVQIKNTSLMSLDLSALEIKPTRDFSGQVELGIKVFTKEALLTLPVEHPTQHFMLNITPVGDLIDVLPETEVSGVEGQPIEIPIGAKLLDKHDSLPDGANYTENNPETIRVEVSGVPDGASLSLPDGTLGVGVDLGNGVWRFDIDAQKLNKLVFNSGDHNQHTWDGNLHFKVQSVDTGLSGDKHLGEAQEFDVQVEVAAVNDKPEIDGDSITTEIDEASGQKLTGITVSDVDYVGSHANDVMTVT